LACGGALSELKIKSVVKLTAAAAAELPRVVVVISVVLRSWNTLVGGPLVGGPMRVSSPSGMISRRPAPGM